LITRDSFPDALRGFALVTAWFSLLSQQSVNYSVGMATEKATGPFRAKA
jgi:hypothetical protein